MFAKRTSFNLKRALDANVTPEKIAFLLEKVSYSGNPEHKRNPGDFGLTPPASPRRDKTLCDGVKIFERKIALKLLQKGIQQGLLSKQYRNDFPQNIWAVTDNEIVLEAQLENSEQGTYHGYPVPETDPFRNIIIEQWKKA